MNELEDKGLLINIGTKGSSAIYKLGVGSTLAQLAHNGVIIGTVTLKEYKENR